MRTPPFTHTSTPPTPRRCGFWSVSALVWVWLALLGGCAAQKFTVDDGRKVNEQLLADMRTYGAGEKALRPAIWRSSELHDKECDTQWELPFAVATSYGWDPDDRVAWVRALGVDERLTVTAIALGPATLEVGDKIVDIAGFHQADAENMTLKLAERRDEGKPFYVSTAGGRTVRVDPFKVCRGYTRLAPPNTPSSQDYHWLMSVHPIEVASVGLTGDEALWVVLWTQGLSEEGGARMKTYHYGVKIIGTLYDIATIATGIRGAALAAETAISAARAAATKAATELIKQQLMNQATEFAQKRMTSEFGDIAQKMSQQEVSLAMQQAAVNRGMLSGVARVGATVFDRADAWAFERMGRLQANPLAGATLHQKLLERRLLSNALVFDVDRLASLDKVARAKGLGDELVATLKGVRPDLLALEQTEMPLASKQQAFSYESDDDVIASNQPFARGLVDGMLELPAESQKPR